MRRQTGQTSVEYLGLAALVAALVGAVLLSATGTGAGVSRSLFRAVGCLGTSAEPCAPKGEPGPAPRPEAKETTADSSFVSKRNITTLPKPAPSASRHILCTHGYLPVGDPPHCYRAPFLFDGDETEAEMYAEAAEAAERAQELSGNVVTAEDWLYDPELLEAFADGVRQDKDGRVIAKRGLLVTAPFVAALAPEALLALAALSAAMLVWHALSGGTAPSSPHIPPLVSPPALPGFASPTLLWTTPEATASSGPPRHRPAEEVDTEDVGTSADPMHALDDVPAYRPGMASVRRQWARDVVDATRRNPLTEDLTTEDVLAVADYTGSWALDMNNYLRGRRLGGARADQVDDHIEAMDRALRHLPGVEATVYRGTFMPRETMERFASGEEVGLPEYLSTSSDITRAERGVTTANGGGTEGENVLVEIETDRGRNIDPLSRYRGRESEVLIPRGGTFEQTGTGTRKIDGKKYKVIRLRQTGG
ncbi:ADP-ribosyltransferase [Streptomyces sp. NPDC059118]|uniref:ADP-ribosyltransferase n=1 Tax=unclassified Streptomyces TaxID=2593676 RepID=UPI0036CF8A87